MSGRRCAVPQLHILDVCLTCDPMCAPCRVGAGGDSRVRRAERALRIGRCPAGTGGGTGCPAGPRRTQTAARGRGPEPGPGREGAGCATRDGDRLGGGTHRATPSRAGRLHPSSRRPRCPLPRPRVALRLGARTSYRPIRQLAAACAHIARPARGKPGGPGPGGERAPAGGQEDSGRACRGRALRPRAARRRGRRQRGLLRGRPGAGLSARRPCRHWSTGRWARRSSVQPKLTGPGKDADPLIVLTAGRRWNAAACRRPGGPARPAAARGPHGHQAARRSRVEVDEARVRPVGADLPPGAGLGAAMRAAVQSCPGTRSTPAPGATAGQLPPAELARLAGQCTLPGDDAARLHRRHRSGADDRAAPADPRRREDPDRQGDSEHDPGSLGEEPVDCAPCEAPDGHPAARRPAALPPAHPRRGAGRGGVRVGAAADRRRMHAPLPGGHRREHGLRRGANG